MVKNAGNIARLADNLADERHAALITSDISRRYFSGFTSSAGMILVTKRQAICLSISAISTRLNNVLQTVK